MKQAEVFIINHFLDSGRNRFKRRVGSDKIEHIDCVVFVKIIDIFFNKQLSLYRSSKYRETVILSRVSDQLVFRFVEQEVYSCFIVFFFVLFLLETAVGLNENSEVTGQDDDSTPFTYM